MTCTRSSYMEPVTSKTNARVDAPSGIASLVAAGTPASCPAQNATDSSVRYSHSNLQPISELRCVTAKVLVLLSRCVSVRPGSTQDTSGSRKRAWVCGYAFKLLRTFCCSLSPRCELKACSCKLAVAVVCRVRSLFNPVIQRPPLSWAVSQAQNTPRWIALLWLDKTFSVTPGDLSAQITCIQAPTFQFTKNLQSQISNNDAFWFFNTYLMQLWSMLPEAQQSSSGFRYFFSWLC